MQVEIKQSRPSLHPSLFIKFHSTENKKNRNSSVFYDKNHQTFIAIVHFPQLSNSLYVDAYQLSNLDEPSAVSYFSSVNQDLEAPQFVTEKALETCLSVVVKIMGKDPSNSAWPDKSIEIPLHLRYHLPSSNPDLRYIPVKLDLPDIYYYRQSPAASSLDVLDIKTVHPCAIIKGNGSASVLDDHDRIFSNYTLVHWDGTRDDHLPSSVTLQVPVGYSGDLTWVSPLTLLLPLLCAIYIGFHTISLFLEKTASLSSSSSSSFSPASSKKKKTVSFTSPSSTSSLSSLSDSPARSLRPRKKHSTSVD